MSSGPRHFGKCKPAKEMAARCTTAAQKRARLAKLIRMVATNEAAIRHAQARVAVHRAEIAILTAALTATDVDLGESKPSS